MSSGEIYVMTEHQIKRIHQWLNEIISVAEFDANLLSVDETQRRFDSISEYAKNAFSYLPVSNRNEQ